MKDSNYINFLSNRFSKPEKRKLFFGFTRMVALLSVMIGSIALIISLSILEGFDLKLRDSAYRFTSHIHIKSFSDSPFDSLSSVIDKIQTRFEFVENVKPTLQKEGLIRAGKNLEGIVINGFDFSNDITNFQSFIIKGSKEFSSDDAKEILLGVDLAEMLGVGVGDDVIMYALLTDANKTIPDSKIRKLKVSGIYETGMTKYDKSMVYIPFKMLQHLIEYNVDQCTGFDVTVKKVNEAPVNALKMERDLGYPFYCMSVQQIHRTLFAWIDLQKEPIPIVLGLISIVAVLNIITMLLITVVEKTKNIGILRALGMPGRKILGIFILQGVRISFIGTVIGLVISFVFSILQQNYSLITLDGDIYFLDAMPIKVIPEYYLVVFIVSMALGFLSTLIPAAIALKITPLQAIKYK